LYTARVQQLRAPDSPEEGEEKEDWRRRTEEEPSGHRRRLTAATAVGARHQSQNAATETVERARVQ
jgi:hypothetical protein